MEPCRIDWIQLPAEDIEKAKAFYTQVFGWVMKPYAEDYWLFESGSLHGGLAVGQKAVQGGVKFSITVADIDQTLEQIKQAGGKLIKAKFEIGNGFGFCAGFEDPNGNQLELYASQ